MKNDIIVTLKELLIKREINIECVLDEDNLNHIAEEFGLKEINFIKAKFRLVPIAQQKGIAVEATLSALVIHSCVVSLGPVPQTISENIAIRYTPDGGDDVLDQYSGSESVKINLQHDYDIEKLVGGQINLYDVIREYLSLSLLPNPRVANAKFDGFTVGALSDTEKQQLKRNLDRIAEGQQPLSQNPFASLASLKQDRE